ncbi:hypothetical protein ACOQFL_09500 [Actinopolyspora sp. H202]|uniref:hypothetical protein n=1 Tax=Actinopolyspora sp. H202 TaxID=1500456 RepID=UPI003EE42497
MPDENAFKAALQDQRIETPSWSYGGSGTRFEVFGRPGIPGPRTRNPTLPSRYTPTPVWRRASGCPFPGTGATTASARPSTPPRGERANEVLLDAYNTDVRPLSRELRKEMRVEPDPISAYRTSGHQEKPVAERKGCQQAGRDA